jgi:Minor capsid.
MNKISVDLLGANQLIELKGLESNGKIQKMLTNQIAQSSERFTPFQQGVLTHSEFQDPKGEYIEYNTPYARYLWHGKLMVDPISGKGASYSQEYGFWSRPGVQKELTNIDLKYSGAPIRGPKWVLRAWETDGAQIIRNLEKVVNK